MVNDEINVSRETFKFYDGDRLLEKTDLDGEIPEIYVSQGLRSKGKTTWFTHKLLDDFLKQKKIFGVLLRYKYELSGVEKRMEDVVRDLYYPDIELESDSYMNGAIKEIFWGDEVCGYGFTLSGYEAVKKSSNMLSKISHYMFDEFQPEDGRYIPEEITKFMSIHKSISRAPGTPVRYVPVYMLSNSVSILNPYYVAWGICSRLKPDTKFLRGNGVVIENIPSDEQFTHEMEKSGFAKAFATHEYSNYLRGESNLKTRELTDIGKVKGEKRYLHTLVCRGKEYGVWRTGNGLYYVSSSTQPNFGRRYGVTVLDRVENTIVDPNLLKMLKRNYRDGYEMGAFRFENPTCKDIYMEFLLT